MSDIIINAKPETSLCTSDFDYFLPEEQIAQHPAEPRDSSRLLCVDRESGKLEHKHFYDIIDHLREGDTLVINDSKVIPARLYGHAEGRPEARKTRSRRNEDDLRKRRSDCDRRGHR